MAEILYDQIPSLDLADFTRGEPNPKRWVDITAGEFLSQRLKEIGLKK